MSTGWEVVDIGGSNSNIILNAPPVLSASVWTNSGYNSNGLLVNDGDGTMSVAFFMDWFAYDVDGTIASVGIDSDLDGIVDVTLPSDSGATDPQSSIQLANGGTMNGGFKLPLEEGVSISRITDFKEDDESPLVDCGLMIQKSFAVIAEDNSGAKPWFQSLHQLPSAIGMMLLMAYKFKRLYIRDYQFHKQISTGYQDRAVHAQLLQHSL